MKLHNKPLIAPIEFEKTFNELMKKAVTQLGIDPDYHNVHFKQDQLVIYHSGREKSYTHKFDSKKPAGTDIYLSKNLINAFYLLFFVIPDAFGVLMLQIPVEGGHCGGDLVVIHEQGETRLDRSHDNGRKFYLSASFIDCAHQISPVTDGWSLFLTYYLTWEKSLVISPHRMDLPTFLSSLNTVKEILSPWQSPTENYDTEMLVIPLTNDYARIPLNYSNLKGNDKTKANLLQSTNLLEVHLATVVNYRAGLAFDHRRMNNSRNDDDGGFPDSPVHLDTEDLLCCADRSRRFIVEPEVEDCCIEEIFNFNGEICMQDAKELNLPIHW